MTKLIEALTTLAEAATEYLKFKTDPITVPQDGNAAPAAQPAAPKKTRKTAEKTEKPADPAAQAQAPAAQPPAVQPPAGNPDPLADLMGAAPAAQPQAPAAAPALTPEQSLLEMKKSAWKVVESFKTPTNNNGVASTEGEDKLRALLAGTFKVAKLMDLTHENRLKFIAEANAIVAGAK